MRTLSRSGFRVWSRDDLEGALAALDQATNDAAIASDSYEMRLYREGYTAALRSLARMFGVDYSTVAPSTPSRVFMTVESTASVLP